MIALAHFLSDGIPGPRGDETSFGFGLLVLVPIAFALLAAMARPKHHKRTTIKRGRR